MRSPSISIFCLGNGSLRSEWQPIIYVRQMVLLKVIRVVVGILSVRRESNQMRKRFTRRSLLATPGAAGVLSALEKSAATPQRTSASNPLEELETKIRAEHNKRWQGSPLGNQYPFIKQMQEEAPQSLAFLKARPRDLEGPGPCEDTRAATVPAEAL